jgi:hypothetical protein
VILASEAILNTNVIIEPAAHMAYNNWRLRRETPINPKMNKIFQKRMLLGIDDHWDFNLDIICCYF